jgi:hypothetical protein
MTMQRYDLVEERGDFHTYRNMEAVEEGAYILHTDYLATENYHNSVVDGLRDDNKQLRDECEQWKRVIVTHVDVIAEKTAEIAAIANGFQVAKDTFGQEKVNLRTEIATLQAELIEARHAIFTEGLARDALTATLRTEATVLHNHKAEIYLSIATQRLVNDKDARIKELTEALEELKRFVMVITLDLQKHRSKTPEQLDGMFHRAYRLYSKYDVEGRNTKEALEVK